MLDAIPHESRFSVLSFGLGLRSRGPISFTASARSMDDSCIGVRAESCQTDQHMAGTIYLHWFNSSHCTAIKVSASLTCLAHFCNARSTRWSNGHQPDLRQLMFCQRGTSMRSARFHSPLVMCSRAFSNCIRSRTRNWFFSEKCSADRCKVDTKAVYSSGPLCMSRCASPTGSLQM